MAARPKAPITSPEITLIQRRTGGVIRDRKAAAILVRISHQAAEPVNTPRVSSPASGAVRLLIPRPANRAANARIVSRLVRVRPRIDR